MPGSAVGLSAAGRIALVADPGSFEAHDAENGIWDPLGFVDEKAYRQRLADARSSTAAGEAVLTGLCRVDGRPLVVVASEFSFLGGSIGIAAARRISDAFEEARALRLPLLALVASGGSRMQEGTYALVQMAALADSARRFRRAGGLYVSYLMNPTTGGALASWASLGSLCLAEPGALVGFAGPRVALALTGEALPRAAQQAETLAEAGWVDGLVEPKDLRGRLCLLLGVTAPAEIISPARPVHAEPSPSDPWEDLSRVRAPDRFGLTEILKALRVKIIELGGDRSGRPDDPALICGLARLGGQPLVLIGHDRSRRQGRVGPAGLSKARRGITLAGELGLPIVTMVDTPGAELSSAAERGAVAGEIALTLEALVEAPIPVISVLLGQGVSGGAVALYPADHNIALASSGLWVLAPEGASAILFRDAGRAAFMARAQGGAARQLHEAGLVDELLDDSDGLAATAERIKGAVLNALASLDGPGAEDLLTRRSVRLKNLATGDDLTTAAA